MNPGSPVGENIGIAGPGNIERRAHPLADRVVPAALILIDVDARILPQSQLSHMSAGAITARNEGRALVLDRPQCLADILHSPDTGRIALRPNQHEVVVHDWKALQAFALG